MSAVPVVTSIDYPYIGQCQTQDPYSDGVMLDVRGSNFSNGTLKYVAVGQYHSYWANVISDTHVQCAFWSNEETVPTGVYHVSVHTTYGSNAASDSDRVWIIPHESFSMSPSTMKSSGGTAQLVGQGLSFIDSVTFNGIAATFGLVDDSHINITIPSQGVLPAGLHNYTVNASGSKTLDWDAENAAILQLAGAPYVASLSPPGGTTQGGTTVTIIGAGLDRVVGVTFGGVASSFYTVNPTTIVATSPAHPSGTVVAVDVIVYDSLGQSSSTGIQFTYTPPSPVVSGITPSSGSTVGGTSVTITGSGFTGATVVAFGASNSPSFSVTNDTTIVAVAPGGGAGQAHVRITANSITSTPVPADYFTYILAAATLTSLSVSAGAATGGTATVITGTNLAGATAVLFGGVPAATFSLVNNTTINATSPPGVGIVDVVVVCPAGTTAVVPGDRFTYSGTFPTVSGLSNNSGPAAGGNAIVVNGSGFGGVTAVSFNGVPATSFFVVNGSTINVVVPASFGLLAGVVDIFVTGPTGVSQQNVADQYTYFIPVPVVSSLSPNNGVPQTTVNIGGSGFSNAGAVYFGKKLCKNFFVSSDTLILATAPDGKDTVDVVVVTSSGSSVVTPADQFAYAPAVPENYTLSAMISSIQRELRRYDYWTTSRSKGDGSTVTFDLVVGVQAETLVATVNGNVVTDVAVDEDSYTATFLTAPAIDDSISIRYLVQFWGDDDITDALNKSIPKYASFFSKEKFASIDVDPTVYEYQLPDDYWYLRRVQIINPPNSPMDIRTGWEPYSDGDVSWLRLYKPVSQGTIRIIYFPNPGSLYEYTDTLSSIGLDNKALNSLVFYACHLLLHNVIAPRLSSSAFGVNDDTNNMRMIDVMRGISEFEMLADKNAVHVNASPRFTRL